MKAPLLLIAAIFFAATTLKADEIFFPTKTGTVLVYKSYDKKDKQVSTIKYTIKYVDVKGSDIDITYLCETSDAKDKSVFKDEVTIQKRGDVLYLDMNKFVNKAAFQQDGAIPAELKVTGNNMEIPTDLHVGESLADASVMMSISLGFLNIKMSADITNRKVAGIEDVTVKGGTFKCYKLTSDVNSNAMGVKMKTQSAEWYAKGVGSVKTVSYDKNGNVQSHTELVEIRQ